MEVRVLPQWEADPEIMRIPVRKIFGKKLNHYERYILDLMGGFNIKMLQICRCRM